MNDDIPDGSVPIGRDDEEGVLPGDARRRAILKALAAAGPVILTVTPFYARAEYVGGQYHVGSVCTNKHGQVVDCEDGEDDDGD